MKSRALVGATLASMAAAATAVALVAAPAIAAPAALASTRTTLSTGNLNVAFGNDVKLKAVVKPTSGTALPTGTVTFNEGATVLGTVSLALVGTVQAAKLTVTRPAIGSHTYTAHYNGSATFATSTSLPLTVTVGPPASVTTISAASKTLLPDQSAKLKAVVKSAIAGTATPSGTVTFKEGTIVLGTSSLALIGTAWTAKLTVSLAIGSHAITATYNGSAQLAPSTSKVLTITVAKGTTSVTVTSAAGTGGNTNITAQVTAVSPPVGVPTGIVSFVIDGSAPQLVAMNTAGKAILKAPLTAGSHTVKASYGGDANYLASEVTVTIVV